MNISVVKVFFDNNIIEYLYQILEKGVENAAPTVDIKEREAILKIWDNFQVVTTSAIYHEVEQGIEGVSDIIKQKIKTKIKHLEDCERKSSTAIKYGEGQYVEGRYGMPDFYHTILNLFKDPNSLNAKRDAQHIVDCYDNQIKWLITIDGKELVEKIGKSHEVINLGITILRPSTFIERNLKNV